MNTNPDEPQVVKKIHLTVKTDANIAVELLDWFDSLNQPPFVERKIWAECKTAFKEGFDNVVDHAHQNLPPDTMIELEVTQFPDTIEIRIWDQGPVFDLESQIQKMPPLPENLGDGGRGLRIIERYSDQIKYFRTDGDRNCLVIIKVLQK